MRRQKKSVSFVTLPYVNDRRTQIEDACFQTMEYRFGSNRPGMQTILYNEQGVVNFEGRQVRRLDEGETGFRQQFSHQPFDLAASMSCATSCGNNPQGGGLHCSPVQPNTPRVNFSKDPDHGVDSFEFLQPMLEGVPMNGNPFEPTPLPTMGADPSLTGPTNALVANPESIFESLRSGNDMHHKLLGHQVQKSDGYVDMGLYNPNIYRDSGDNQLQSNASSGITHDVSLVRVNQFSAIQEEARSTGESRFDVNETGGWHGLLNLEDQSGQQTPATMALSQVNSQQLLMLPANLSEIRHPGPGLMPCSEPNGKRRRMSCNGVFRTSGPTEPVHVRLLNSFRQTDAVDTFETSESSDQSGDSFSKLKNLMRVSEETQRALQEWDKKKGLPKSHSCTMVKTSRSRRQILEGRILPKWDGTPLISDESQDIFKPRRKRKKNSLPDGDGVEDTEYHREKLPSRQH